MSWRPWLECAGIAAAYVLPMHQGRPAPRDDPRTIYRRAAGALAACCVAWLPLWHALHTHTQDAGKAWGLLPAALGLKMEGLSRAVFAPVTLTAALFLGPLAMRAIDFVEERQGRRQRRDEDGEEARQQRQRPPAAGPRALRDYVMAPLTEEFAFRACMAPLLLLRGTSLKRTVALVPLFFGAAHLHHLYELVTLQRRPVGAATQQVLAQFLYTCIFGWYATWLFVRTGHLAAPIAAHALCNLLGFPDFDRMTAHPAAALLTGATAAGVGLFGVLLRPLTDPAFCGGGGIADALPRR